MRDVYLLGLGQTEVGEHWEVSLRQLALTAIDSALKDAGIKMTERGPAPEALFVGNMLAPQLSRQAHLGALIADFSGLRGIEAATVEASGASGGAAFRQACLAIASGYIDSALAVGVEKLTDTVGPGVSGAASTSTDTDWEGAQGATPTAIAALIMRRYMHETDTALPDFAGFSVNAHANAKTNPNAMFRNSLTAEAFVKASMVAEPVNMFDTAPDAERSAMRTALAGWAAQAARDGIASAEEGARFSALHAARVLLEEAVATAGADPAIADVAAAIEPEYWPEYETHMHALMAARDFGEAYRLATEALSDADLPPARRPAFEDFRAETLTARIVSLIDRAVVATDEHREWEAVGALERAETLFRSATTLSAERRELAAARLAEGYTQLGRRRVETGEFEDAVDPLFRALRIGPPNGDNRDEARWALVQAIRGVVDTRVAMIREVASGGGRDSAMVQADKLWALLRSGIAAGVPQESMTAALATTRQLIEDLGGTT